VRDLLSALRRDDDVELIGGVDGRSESAALRVVRAASGKVTAGLMGDVNRPLCGSYAAPMLVTTRSNTMPVCRGVNNPKLGRVPPDHLLPFLPFRSIPFSLPAILKMVAKYADARIKVSATGSTNEMDPAAGPPKRSGPEVPRCFRA